MSADESGKHLLFGLLALQNHFVNRDGLVAAFGRWLTNKSLPLSDVMIEMGALRPEHKPLLESLVAAHIQAHEGDPGRSLAALNFSSGGSVAEAIASIQRSAQADAGVMASLVAMQSMRGAVNREADETIVRDPVDYLAGLGRYQILRPHKRGGLGQVFVARDSELRRNVALKEILPEKAHYDELRTRFVVEAEINGNLEHPGIVPVYGMGRYADGRPYYAMRFVDGDSLKDAIETFHESKLEPNADGTRDSTDLESPVSGGPEAPASPSPPDRKRNKRGGAHGNSLALRALLRRYVDVCNAIGYAHSRGVLHRDLKPANVMLGKYGETLIIDWGLAKATGKREVGFLLGSATAENTLVPPSGSDVSATQAGTAIGTPHFMSPEQARGELERLGPATDIYALGGVLYSILTGRPPVEGETAGDALANALENRIVAPRLRNAEIAAPLEAICLKALSKAPEDRYASARALADDVDNWLADEPVAAYRETWSERAGRWGRRNQASVAAAASVLITAVLGLGLATFIVTFQQIKTEEQRIRADAASKKAVLAENSAKRERDAALVARNEANQERNAALTAKQAAVEQKNAADEQAEVARRTAEFLADLFNASDPFSIAGLAGRAGGEQADKLTARMILDRGSEKIQRGLEGQERVRASLMTTIGSVYRSLGIYDKAEPLLEGAKTLRDSLGAKDLDRSDTLFHLGWFHHDMANYEQALSLYQEALDIRAGSEPNGKRHGLSLLNLGWMLADQQIRDAEPMLKQAIQVLEKLRGEERVRSFAQLGLAGFLLDQERPAEAVPLIASGFSGFLARGGAEKVVRAAAEFQLGAAADSLGAYGIAEARLRESLKLATDAIGETHPYRTFPLYQLACTLARANKSEEALRLFEECLTLTNKIPQGLSHPRASFLVQSYATALLEAGKEAEAVALCDRLIDERRRKRPDSTLVAGAMVTKAMVLEDRPNQSVESLYRDAIAMYQKNALRYDRDKYYAIATNNLARLLTDRGKAADAEPLYRSLHAFMTAEKANDANFAVMLDNYARCLGKLGRFQEAEERFKQSIAAYERLAPPKRYDATTPMFGLAELDEDRALYEVAERRFRENLEYDLKHRGNKPLDLAADYRALGRVLAELNRTGEAVASFQTAITNEERGKPDSKFDLAYDYWRVALVSLLSNDIDGYRRTCAAMLEKFGDSQNAGVLEALVWAHLLVEPREWNSAPLKAAADRLYAARPDNQLVVYLIARARVAAADHAEALKLVEKGLTIRSNYTDHLRMLQAQILHEQGQEEQARELATRARAEIERRVAARVNGRVARNWTYRWYSKLVLRQIEKTMGTEGQRQ